MHILLTGGTGFIGSHFIKCYDEYRYTVLSRSQQSAKSLLPANVEVIASLQQFDQLDDFDAVINLAGEPIIDKRWSDQQKARIQNSRWNITERLVELIKASSNPPAVFLSGSAIGIYADTGDHAVDESEAGGAVADISTNANTDFAKELCAHWEQLAEGAAPYSRTLMLRTGIVLGAGGGALKRMILPFKLGLGGPIGSGEQYMSWIHIDDMMEALHFLLTQSELSGPFNFTAPQPVTNREFTKTLALACRRPAFMRVPAGLLRVLMGESSSLLLGSQRVLPLKLQQAGFEFKFGDLEAALHDLLG